LVMKRKYSKITLFKHYKKPHFFQSIQKIITQKEKPLPNPCQNLNQRAALINALTPFLLTKKWKWEESTKKGRGSDANSKSEIWHAVPRLSGAGRLWRFFSRNRVGLKNRRFSGIWVGKGKFLKNLNKKQFEV
jgi:hypothetical protein